MIVIIGGGLSGLSAARTLLREGRRDFCVLEAGSHPGGRVHTHEHDGFHLDAGFQVCLDSYPAFRSQLPLADLDPCYFGSGALVEETPGHLQVLANPLWHPGSIGDALTSKLPWADRLRLIRLALRVMLADDETLLADTGMTSREFLSRQGFSDQVIECFFEPFFGGVFLDPDLETDSSLLRYYLRMFATGRAFIPRGGIKRLGESLAASLPEGHLRYGCAVEAIMSSQSPAAVRLSDGETILADEIILAADPATTCRLLDWPQPSFRTTRVVYYKSRHPVYEGKWLVLPSAKPRLAQHFVQASNIDPALAPPGWHLLSATVLDDQGRSEDELFGLVKDEVSRLFPRTGPTLEPLHQIAVPRALPAQSPEFRETYRKLAADQPPRVHLAGDLAGNASLQNALGSGHRAAVAVLGNNP